MYYSISDTPSIFQSTCRMGLKTYVLRLDEEVYESLKKALQEYGDPELSISFVVRKYLRDLNDGLPHLKKSELGLMNNLSRLGRRVRFSEAYIQGIESRGGLKKCS